MAFPRLVVTLREMGDVVSAFGARHLMCDQIPAHGCTINGFERHDQADLLVFHAMPKILPVGGVLKDFVCPVLRAALRSLSQFGTIAFNNNSK